MIDWFRGELLFEHDPIPAGKVLSISPNGELEWESAKAIMCRSSFETSLKIKSHVVLERSESRPLEYKGRGAWGHRDEPVEIEHKPYTGKANSLLIDGNLCKFLQGHNVFGTRDLNRLLYLAFKKICDSYSEHFRNDELAVKRAEQRILKGDYLVKMLDINQLYDCGNDASVEAWLHAAEMRAKCRSGRASRDKGTVYLAQTSKRWAFKFYNKWRELQASKKHQLPNDLQGLGLESFIVGKLRAELRIFALELQKHGVTHGYHLTESVIDHLFTDYLAKIDMTQQATLVDEQLMKLPVKLYGTYQLWRQGACCKDMLPKTTFYSHRKQLLEHGIDILSMHLAPEHNNVVPMIRIIEAVPVAIPQWAYDKNLIAM